MARRRSRGTPAAVLAILLALLLAACARLTPPGGGEQPPVTLAELNLQVSAGPLTFEGPAEPISVVVRVTDSSGAFVSFTEELIIDEDGPLDGFTFRPNEDTPVVSLTAGETFGFHASAYDSNGNFVASGRASHTLAANRMNAVHLVLSTHLGAATLQPRLPISVLLPGQEVDLVLAVSAHGRLDLEVPTSSFTASYDVHNGATLGHGPRGIRFQALEREPGDVSVTATASGLVVAGDQAVEGDVGAEFTMGFSSAVGIDLEHPEIRDLSFDPGLLTLWGVASDNFGVAALDVFDGPVHLASTDLQTVDDDALATVHFPGGGTGFFAVLDLEPGDYELTVVARDASGNQSELSRIVTVPGS